MLDGRPRFLANLTGRMGVKPMLQQSSLAGARLSHLINVKTSMQSDQKSYPQYGKSRFETRDWPVEILRTHRCQPMCARTTSGVYALLTAKIHAFYTKRGHRIHVRVEAETPNER